MGFGLGVAGKFDEAALAGISRGLRRFHRPNGTLAPVDVVHLKTLPQTKYPYRAVSLVRQHSPTPGLRFSRHFFSLSHHQWLSYEGDTWREFSRCVGYEIELGASFAVR